METEFSIKGFWWLPENEEEQLAGILTYKPGEPIFLDLFGAFSKKNGELLSEQHEIILGVSSSGQLFTLVDTSVIQRKSSIPGFPETRILVNLIYRGLHFSNSAEIRFHTLRVEFSNLDDWVCINGFLIDVDPKKREAKIEYRLPPEVECSISDSLKVSISFFAKTSLPRGNPQIEATVRQEVEFHIISDQEIPIGDLLRYQYLLNTFLRVAIGRSTKVLRLTALTERSKIEMGDFTCEKPISIYFSQFGDFSKLRTMNPLDMLFTFPRIQDRFGAMLSQWFREFSGLEDVFHLYFKTIYDKHLDLTTKLLNFVQAIESFHRKKIGSAYIEKEEYINGLYLRICDSIPSDLDTNFKNSLMNRIKYGYEYSLRKRLEDIFYNFNNGVIHELFGQNRDVLINRIVVNRNYYTHYDDRSKDLCEGSRLYRLCNNLEVILTVIFLSLLGFTDSEISSMIRDNPRLMQMARMD
ncbi:MAG: hypothetical protein BWX81_00002 [Spirochaetes bacterium ADurb.Bin110]|nr:MAG: hypothetical protein BWX81_00002 [Spirochaetes bacterium ADurb.Bin110]